MHDSDSQSPTVRGQLRSIRARVDHTIVNKEIYRPVITANQPRTVIAVFITVAVDAIVDSLLHWQSGCAVAGDRALGGPCHCQQPSVVWRFCDRNSK